MMNRTGNFLIYFAMHQSGIRAVHSRGLVVIMCLYIEGIECERGTRVYGV